jgi:cold shock CspA family protein
MVKSARRLGVEEIVGVVHEYDSDSKAGFVATNEQQRYFFDARDVTDGPSIEVGQVVTFEPGTSPRGPRARRVAVWGKAVPFGAAFPPERAGEVTGRVVQYIPRRGFGFIAAGEEQRYFFHITDVTDGPPIEVNHIVTFEPGASPKGPRARRVVARGRYVPLREESPEDRRRALYRYPDHFIMSREPTVEGYVIDRVVIDDCWGKDFDPNKAKGNLREYAIAQGANAIVNLRLEKYPESPNSVSGPLWLKVLSIAVGNENYKQTMHRFHGTAVVLKKRVVTPQSG